jgi:hypothetical protein
MDWSGITAIVSIVSSFILGYLVYVNTREARKNEDILNKERLRLENKNSGRSDMDSIVNAAKELMDPLRLELGRSKLELRIYSNRQTQLVKAIDDYLKERQVKLHNIPGCSECLAADWNLKSKIQQILVDGEITTPLKGE